MVLRENKSGFCACVSPTMLGGVGQTDRSNLRTKKMLDDVGLNVWPDSNFIQHRPTSSNITQHDGQTSPICCAECWMAMLDSFGQGLMKMYTCSVMVLGHDWALIVIILSPSWINSLFVLPPPKPPAPPPPQPSGAPTKPPGTSVHVRLPDRPVRPWI